MLLQRYVAKIVIIFEKRLQLKNIMYLCAVIIVVCKPSESAVEKAYVSRKECIRQLRKASNTSERIVN